MPIENCPQELIIEILSRLPVKVLLKFKSVCKNWYEIIKNPYFIKKHLQNNYESDDGHLLIQRFIPESGLYGFESFTDKTLANNLDLPSSVVVDPYLQNTAFARVFGPLHGLYLLFNRKDRFALWNPGTREFKPLPSHPITDEFETDQFYNEPPVVGFGHDPSTNDYKVAWYIREDGRVDTMFLLYSLRNDCWRELKLDGSILSKSNVWLNSSLHNSNTYWNGFYYWTASISHVQQLKIYAMDMVNESFLEIQGPPVPFNSLTICNGRLATRRIINLSIEIWVMDSMGFWTKQLTIGPIANFRYILGYWINGGIFCATNTRDSRLILCNPNEELRDLGPRGDSNVYIHKESLVSLQSRNSNKKENVSTDLVAPIRAEQDIANSIESSG
ncbi:hypothetical protein LguiB_028308 [Lonicera macranthoides]